MGGGAGNFLRFHQFVFRCPTHVSLYTPAESEQMRESFVQSVMALIRINNVTENLLVNMDETAMYFDTHHNYTVNEKKRKLYKCSMYAVTTSVALCAVLLQLMETSSLFNIQGCDQRSIANSLPEILPADKYGCTKSKGWMNDKLMELWKEAAKKLIYNGSMN